MTTKNKAPKSKKPSDEQALDRLHEALAERPASNGPVTLIEDPFGITPSQDLEDLDLSLSDSETELSEPELPESEEADLERLSRAMEREQEHQIATLTETVGESEADATARLAREIAEDEALAAAEKSEAEAELASDPELKAALPSIDEDGNVDPVELQSCVETLLFMSDKPVSAKKLREMLGESIPFPAIQEALTELKDRYSKPGHGIELAEIGGGFQLRTKPIRSALAKKLSRIVTQRLSTGAMESLAIIAYKQPVMKEEIDQIRGVDSSHFIRTLLDRKLIRIAGRSELPGRPMLYATSDEFLEMFGLKDLDAMPPLRELESMIPASQTGSEEDEDPRVKQMRKLVADMKSSSQSILDYDPKDDEKFLQEMREKVNAIPTSTATLEAQKEAERLAKLARAAGKAEPAADASGQFALPSEPASEA